MRLGIKRQAKMGNVKTVIDGITFDSKREAKRYCELKILQKGKIISDLRCQVKFELIPAQKGGIRTEREVAYYADFVYQENGKTVIEDTKGHKTIHYIIKRKLMKLNGNEITEI
jgi:hypothetical protein